MRAVLTILAPSNLGSASLTRAVKAQSYRARRCGAIGRSAVGFVRAKVPATLVTKHALFRSLLMTHGLKGTLKTSVSQTISEALKSEIRSGEFVHPSRGVAILIVKTSGVSADAGSFCERVFRSNSRCGCSDRSMGSLRRVLLGRCGNPDFSNPAGQ